MISFRMKEYNVHRSEWYTAPETLGPEGTKFKGFSSLIRFNSFQPT